MYLGIYATFVFILHDTLAVVTNNITALEGETIIFRCKTNLPSLGLQRSWTNKSRVIYANNNLLPQDERISLVKNNKQDYAMQVKGITVYDEGAYTCTVYADKIKQHTQYLKVYVPPRLTKVSPDVTIDENGTTILQCSASGKPTPKITWRHLIPSADGIRATSDYLPLGRISRDSAGVYECTADNSVSAPVKAKIKVTVRYRPEVDGPNYSVIGNVLNRELELECIATGVPEPTFSWTHPTDERLKKKRIRVLNIKRGNTVSSKLIIQKSIMADYGNYTCTAMNAMGEDSKKIRLERVLPESTRPPPNLFFAQSQNVGGSASKQVSLLQMNIIILIVLTLLL